MVQLTDNQRRSIHDLALEARELLTREARELLEGVYGLYPDGRLDPPTKLPQVQADPEAAETYRRLAQFLADEERAGLPHTEAVDKLVKETAFTHLNRLVAFKMMEARRLIRGTLDRGAESNAFKFYLADPAHAADLACHQAGDADTAYRHFLLWQSGRIAQEIRVLFDPDTLPSRLFPRPLALRALLAQLNRLDLADIWSADETIGWVYQFFNEQEKADVFERLYRQKLKIRRQDIPAATQLFTPHWIVRFLVQNTLGRLWAELHPDTRLLGTELLDYLVDVKRQDHASRFTDHGPRLVKTITLLDPACGTMHFGLVAFDLLAAMYQEELDRAGEPDWPQTPSVSDPAEIPAAIIEHNLFGIDIDLRAVQLSALALYLKAKALNPQARITDSHLACADVRPLNGARLGAFLRQARFSRPVYERLMRALWARLQDVDQLGSLLRLERELGELIAQERARYEKEPLFAGLAGEYEREAAEEEFWAILSAQIVQGLDEFTRQQAQAGADMTFFAGEAVKGLRLAELMLRRYDVVVTNPPYSGKRNLGDALADHLDGEYPDAKGDLYTAFIQRCGEFADEGGRVGMITQQSFMFLSSYEKLRAHLRGSFAIETMAHTGPRAFAEISGEKVNTTVFCLRADADTLSRENSVGTYFRLVNAPEGDAKRQAFEQALAALRAQEETMV
ncbi:MAG: Eco57I restriction-modification methylase domain-containing protein [Chloroflexota bacterium]